MGLLPQYITQGTAIVDPTTGAPKVSFLNYVNGTFKSLRDQLGQIITAQSTADTAQTTANTAISGLASATASIAAIGDNGLLTKQYKTETLIPDAAQLELVYQQTIARANAVSVSHTDLDTARTNWLSLLASYSPVWNDNLQNTDIYTTVLNTTQQSFPVGWVATNALTSSVTAPYVTLTDPTTSQWAYIDSSSIPASPGQGLSAGIVVKKSATHTTNWVLLRILDNNLAFADAYLNPYNGLFSTNSASLPAGSFISGDAIDIGSDWYLRLTFANFSSTTTAVTVQIFPAVASGDAALLGSSSYSVTSTGSIQVKGCPDVALGDWPLLGRNMLIARYSAYVNSLKTVDNAVSVITGTTASWTGVSGTGKPEDSADITRWMDGPPQSTVFQYDYTGTAQSGEFPRDLTFKLLTPAGQITTGITWTYSVQVGTVNGFTNASGAQAMSGAGTGTLTVSSLGSGTATVLVSAVYSGKTIIRTFDLSQNIAAPPTSNTSGGSGTTTLASKSSGFNNISNTTFVDVTGALNGTMPTGKTTATVNVVLHAMPASGTSGAWTVECKVMRDISGTPTQIGTVQTGSSDWIASDLSGDYAYFNFGIADTGLTAGTAYVWRVYMRLQSGSRTHGVTGTVSVTA